MTEPALDGVSRGPSMLDDLFPADAVFRRSMWSYVVLLALAGFIAPFGLAEAFGIPVAVEITYVAAVREQATSAP